MNKKKQSVIPLLQGIKILANIIMHVENNLKIPTASNEFGFMTSLYNTISIDLSPETEPRGSIVCK